MESLRGTRLSVSVILLALAWRVGEHLISPLTVELSCLLLICGTALLVSAGRVSQNFKPVSRTVLLTLAGMCLAMTIVTGRWQAFLYAGCCIIILIGAMAGLRAKHHVIFLTVAAVVIALCGASTVALRHLAWHLHDIPVPDGVGALTSNLIPGVGSSRGFLTLWTGKGLEVVRLTFEGLGLYEAWYVAVALAGLTSFSRGERRLRILLASLGIILLYSPVRFGLLAALAIESGKPHLMLHPVSAILSWLPLAFVIKPPHGLDVPLCMANGARGSTALTLLPVLAGIALACVFGLSDPGNLKEGRVVVDETHSNWEWTQEPFDTTSLGIRAEYNYYCLHEYLKSCYRVEANTRGITQSLLDTVDVLIVKTPTEPFLTEEIEAIAEFVKRGGGLLLIGDHTNLFGMSDFLNPIARTFGMAFRYDDTFDLATSSFTGYHRPGAAFHPSVRNLRDFEFLTSCTLEGDLLTQPVMVGSGVGSEDIDYGHPNFFGNIAFDLCDRFGLFLQAGAKRLGRGRVLLFTDSTCFSNFCMFAPGREELILGFMDYLNREGRRYPWLRPTLWAVFGVIGGLCLLRFMRVVGGLTWLCVGLCAGLVQGTCIVAYLNGSLYGPIPEPTTPPVVLFDTQHTPVSLFHYIGQGGRWGSEGFEQFYLCAQRIGIHPQAGGVSDVTDLSPHGLILLNPCISFSPGELDCLAAYVERGGRLLVLDSVLNHQSTANEVLMRYGMMLHLSADISGMPSEDQGPSRHTEAAVYTLDGAPDIVPKLRIQGGQPLRKDHHGVTVVAGVRAGAGIVTVAVDSFYYSESVLGPVLQTGRPSALTRQLYRDACGLLEDVFLADL